MAKLKITLSFRDKDSYKEVKIGNKITGEYEDFNYKTFLYEANALTTVKEIYEYALEFIDKFDKTFIDKYIIFYEDIMFMFFIQDCHGKVSKIVDNKDAKIIDVLNYLGIDGEFKLFNCDFGIGGLWKQIEGVRFFTHSNEENHKHMPHIHTVYDNKDATYSILSGDKLAGEKYPYKIEKQIKKEIEDNKEELLEFWEDTTNGIFNPHFPHIEKI